MALATSPRRVRHPVRDDEEPEFLVYEEVVLVVVAHLADIGGGIEAMESPSASFDPDHDGTWSW